MWWCMLTRPGITTCREASNTRSTRSAGSAPRATSSTMRPSSTTTPQPAASARIAIGSFIHSLIGELPRDLSEKAASVGHDYAYCHYRRGAARLLPHRRWLFLCACRHRLIVQEAISAVVRASFSRALGWAPATIYTSGSRTGALPLPSPILAAQIRSARAQLESGNPTTVTVGPALCTRVMASANPHFSDYRDRREHIRWIQQGFAPDSLVEGSGFELSVPR